MINKILTFLRFIINKFFLVETYYYICNVENKRIEFYRLFNNMTKFTTSDLVFWGFMSFYIGRANLTLFSYILIGFIFTFFYISTDFYNQIKENDKQGSNTGGLLSENSSKTE